MTPEGGDNLLFDQRVSTRGGPSRKAGPRAIAKPGNFANMLAVATDGDSLLRQTVRAFIFAALYFAAMVGAISLTRFGAQVSPLWIASAVLAWALISAPTRHWPLVLGASALAHVTAAWIVGDQTDVEIIYLIANLASPLVFASIMRARGDEMAFEDRREVLWFLLIGGVIAPFVSTTISTVGTFVDFARFSPRVFSIWFLSDALSFVAFLPILKTLAEGDWRDLFTPGSRRKSVVLFTILIAAHAISWMLPAAGYRIFLLLLLAYSILMAFELGLAGSRAAIGITVILLVAGALFAPVPADRGLDPQQYLLALQVYMAVLVVSVLPMAAALAEKQRLYETASEALHDAQSAWGELIAAEAHYRLMADNTTDMILRLSLEGAILFASPACSKLSADTEALHERLLTDLCHEDDRLRVRSEIEQLVLGGALDRPRSFQARLKDVNGDWRQYDVSATLTAPHGGAADEIVAVLRQAPA